MSDSGDDDLPDWVVTSQSPPKGKAKPRRIQESDSSEEEQDKGARGAGPSLQAPAAVHAAALHAGKATVPSQQHTDQPAQPADEAALGDAVPDAEADDTAAPAAGAPVAGVLRKGEIAIMLPDKLPTTKILLELRASDHNHNTDLAGDAGAVGRMVTGGCKDGTSESFKVDLKGVLYNTTVLPLAGTALVLNIGTSEAKVEAIMHDFVRLQEEFSAGLDTVEGDLGDLFAGSDDEVYQVADEGAPADGQAAAGDKGAKKKGAAAAKKPSKRAPAKGLAGGVKKVRKPAGARKPAKAGKAPGKAAAARKAKSPAAAKAKGDTKPKAAAKPKAAKKKSDSSEEDMEVDTEDDGDDDDDDYSE